MADLQAASTVSGAAGMRWMMLTGESADAGEDDEGASLAKRDHACLCHLQTQCKLFQDRGNHSCKGGGCLLQREEQC